VAGARAAADAAAGSAPGAAGASGGWPAAAAAAAAAGGAPAAVAAAGGAPAAVAAAGWPGGGGRAPRQLGLGARGLGQELVAHLGAHLAALLGQRALEDAVDAAALTAEAPLDLRGQRAEGRVHGANATLVVEGGGGVEVLGAEGGVVPAVPPARVVEVGPVLGRPAVELLVDQGAGVEAEGVEGEPAAGVLGGGEEALEEGLGLGDGLAGLAGVPDDDVGGPVEAVLAAQAGQALEGAQVARRILGLVHHPEHARAAGLEADADGEAGAGEQRDVLGVEIVGAGERPELPGHQALGDDPGEHLTPPAAPKAEQRVGEIDDPAAQIGEGGQALELGDGALGAIGAPLVVGLGALHTEGAVVGAAP
jgi:hypothetical protein